MTTFLLVLSLLIAVGRCLIPSHALSWPGTYEALAHIWVGVLLALIFARPDRRRASIILLAVLTGFEVVMFFIRK